MTTSLVFLLFKLGYNLSRPFRRDISNLVPANQSAEPDLTGRVMMASRRVEMVNDDARRIVFAYFDTSLAHSFWRAQELSLFKRVSAFFDRPIMDFGCGDGSFSACIFDNVDFGVDIDKTALSIAQDFGIYGRLLNFTEMVTAVPASSVAAVFSCSVLEHTIDLGSCIYEIARVLKPGGRFYFSVPSPGFTDQMIELIDRTFAETVNNLMFHRNLLSDFEWRALLKEHGLYVERFDSFQSIEFTRRYFCLHLLGSRATGRIPGLAGLRGLYWRSYRNSLLNEVAQSVDHPAPIGANFFITGAKI
jgi:SAM-dependent methyltransferase